jgi:hypothetical protein
MYANYLPILDWEKKKKNKKEQRFNKKCVKYKKAI